MQFFFAYTTGFAKFSRIYSQADTFIDSFFNGTTGYINGYGAINTLLLTTNPSFPNADIVATLTTGGLGTVNLIQGNVIVGSDTLLNIQDVSAQFTNSRLIVQAGADADDNVFVGTPGQRNVIDYTASTHGVTIDFFTGKATGIDIGTDTLTGFLSILLGAGNNFVYTDFGSFQAIGVVGGLGGFNTLVERAGDVSVTINGANLGDPQRIQELVLFSGHNVVAVAPSDTDFIYIYGGFFSAGDMLSLGSGGGWLVENEAGNNILTGSSNASSASAFLGGGAAHNVMNGGAGTNVYYTTGNDRIHGAGIFNTDILLSANVALQYGASFDHVQEVVLNSGTNSVDMTGSTDFVYLYGGTGSDSLYTGLGGGYLIDNLGGFNSMYGGGGTNVFIGGGASHNTMYGGNGSNVYYVTANDTVVGYNGVFNTVVELNPGVTEILGAAARQNIQEVICSGGDNTVDASANATAVYLYGNNGNDMFTGSSGNDYFWGGAGGNTFAFQPGWGQDTIVDWTTGSNNVIDLSKLASAGVHGISDITQAIVSGSDVISSIHTGMNSITVYGIGSTLGASSFHFA